MTDTRDNLSSRDVELLQKRVESSRYIWENIEIMNGFREPLWTANCAEDESCVPTSANIPNDAADGSQNHKELWATTDTHLTVHKQNYPAKDQGNNFNNRARGKPPTFRKASSASKPTVHKALCMPLISSGVSISSKESVAASHPLGFQNLIKHDGSSEGLNKIGYKSENIKPMVCNFCKNNREIRDIYLTHYLYDPETKILSCPVLRKHICEICGGTGDNAHTLQYCRINKERNGYQGPVMKMLTQCTITNSVGKIRKN